MSALSLHYPPSVGGILKPSFQSHFGSFLVQSRHSSVSRAERLRRRNCLDARLRVSSAAGPPVNLLQAVAANKTRQNETERIKCKV